MAPQRPEYYVIDDASNYTSINAKTQTDVLYFERDTGRYKLGRGDRWNDTPYYAPGMSVDVDEAIQALIDSKVTSVIENLDVEPRIDEKKTAFNKDFGETAESVARGCHVHNVSDIIGLKIPRGVKYPSTPKGDILHDDGEFHHIDAIATSEFKSHANSTDIHTSPDEKKQIHPPVTVSGDGIQISGQTISLKIGMGDREVCPGGHYHPEYAPEQHTHNDAINPSRLPAITKTSRGAVPPTGNPSGRCLHDDGNWRYPQQMIIIPLSTDMPTWVSPYKGRIVLVSVNSIYPTTSGASVNTITIAAVDTIESRIQGVCSGNKEVSVDINVGDVVQTITPRTNVQLSILLNG